MKIRILLALLTLTALSGCGYVHRFFAGMSDYSFICVEETHVQYVQFTSGVSPLIDKDGKPVSCK